MAKIFILITLLLLCTLVQGQVSPCPQYFTYIVDPTTNEVMGKIKISSPPKNVQLHLKVTLKIGVELPTKYGGELQLAKKKKKAVRAVEQGRPLLYHVRFPLHQPIPTLTEIWLNDEQYCSGPSPTGNVMTTIVLKHTLTLPNVVPLSNSQSNDDPTRASMHWSSIPNKATIARSSSVTLSQGIDNNVFPNPPMTSQHDNDNNNNSNIFRNPITVPQPAPQNDNNNNNNNECGVNQHIGSNVNLLIANGEKTLPGQWPWLVALFLVKTQHEFQCAGSILTNRHVITAAHCLKFSLYSNDTIPPNVLEVALGRFKLYEFREYGTVNREVANYMIHPDYAHTNTGHSDLAILILRTSIEYSPFIKPICLWSGSTILQNAVNKTGYVAGWGRDEFGHRYTEEPRMAKVPIVSQTLTVSGDVKLTDPAATVIELNSSNDEDPAWLHELQAECLWSDPRFVFLTSNCTFCAGLRDNSGPCNGDSGSGLILYDVTTNRYQLRGIVSRSVYNRSQPICDLTKYIVYVDVAQYIPWIQEQISTT